MQLLITNIPKTPWFVTRDEHYIAITIIFNFFFFHTNALHSVFLVCSSSRAFECNLHHILKMSVMTVDASCHQFFRSPLQIRKTIYRLNLQHSLPKNPLTQDHQVPVKNDYQASYSLKFLRAHRVPASVLSGTTPLPIFSCSGIDTGFERRCSFGCSSAEEIVQSFNAWSIRLWILVIMAIRLLERQW